MKISGCGCLVLVVLLLAFVIGAFSKFYTTETVLGDCVGVGETRVDSLVYEPDVGNIIIGVVLIETVVVPIYIGFTATHCPVDIK